MTSMFQMIDSPSAAQRLRISWELVTLPEDCPDVSWLEPDSGRYDDVTDAAERQRCEEADAERLAAFHAGDWHMVGVIARARIFVPVGGTSFRVMTLDSAGLWGVESDAGDYFREVFAEQRADLLAELRTLAAALGAEGGFDEELPD